MPRAALWVALAACALAACGGSSWPRYEQLESGPPADPPDAGPPPVLPPSFSYTTARGTLTGPDAFQILTGQTILQTTGDGGASYIGFQLADTPQCVPAEIDGGTPGPSPQSHILTGFVKREDGAPVQMGTYPIGLSPDGGIDAYLQWVEFDRDAGADTMMLAISGTLTLESLSHGQLTAKLNVELGDATNQLELPLTGDFVSDTCVPQ